MGRAPWHHGMTWDDAKPCGWRHRHGPWAPRTTRISTPLRDATSSTAPGSRCMPSAPPQPAHPPAHPRVGAPWPPHWQAQRMALQAALGTELAALEEELKEHDRSSTTRGVAGSLRQLRGASLERDLRQQLAVAEQEKAAAHSRVGKLEHACQLRDDQMSHLGTRSARHRARVTSRKGGSPRRACTVRLAPIWPPCGVVDSDGARRGDGAVTARGGAARGAIGGGRDVAARARGGT
jgi:hypothetical protein